MEMGMGKGDASKRRGGPTGPLAFLALVIGLGVLLRTLRPDEPQPASRQPERADDAPTAATDIRTRYVPGPGTWGVEQSP